MISEARGNLLEADVDALVNTVNTVGVMGKGIALQFKRAYPTMFKDYARLAKSGDLALGRMHVWEVGGLDGPRFIINFPTKGHWRSSSKIGDIDAGLEDLAKVIVELGIQSIAVPPLGCGHGGLQWHQVEPLIHKRLGQLTDVDVRVYPPVGAPSASEMVTTGTAPRMTAGRAALVEMVNRYSEFAVDGVTPIEAQKLMYFLQAAGEPLRLRFERHYYGPYADNLRAVLRDVEGHYLSGFGDGSQSVESSEPIRVLKLGHEAAATEMASHRDTAQRIDDVMELISGWESSYALELLSTVHWLLTEDPGLEQVPDRMVATVHAWSPRKQRMFPDRHVRTALATLADRGWSQPSATVASSTN